MRTASQIIWRYKEANYEKACQMINETYWDGLLCDDNVNCLATNWHKFKGD